ncbi:MAG TPA: hypothetical protein DD670_05820 [Planctomycetaceae bacterium]|nr:hypothetical protein [Planctomycetaceae bacterium]
MGFLRKHARRITFAAGVLLILYGLLAIYYWYYLLAPVRRIMDPNWRAAHSEQAYWQEMRNVVNRTGVWEHDSVFPMGRYGDECWAEEAIKHCDPDAKWVLCCSPGDSLTYMTNQEATQRANDWHEWWKQNKHKSQVEWIQDGFAQHGITATVPPSPETIEALLKLLDKPEDEDIDASEEEETGEEVDEVKEIPGYLRYNAYRWLRDSGFEPVRYLLSNRDVSPEVARGLLEYAKFEREWPKSSGVGILPFGKKTVDDGFEGPPMTEPSFQRMAALAIFVPSCLGVFLLVWSICGWRRQFSMGGQRTIESEGTNQGEAI